MRGSNSVDSRSRSPVDQLDFDVFSEDAGRDHPMVFIHPDGPGLELQHCTEDQPGVSGVQLHELVFRDSSSAIPRRRSSST
jgi:hypothetical protein